MRRKLIFYIFILIAASCSIEKSYGQADTLVDMLEKKGLLTQREAKEVKEQMSAELLKEKSSSKLRLGSWLDELTLSGDVRLRYDKLFNREAPQGLGTFPDVDRTRFFYRLRLGITAKAGDWTAGLRLASGDTAGPNADAISTNTTFDNSAAKKPINLDLAFLSYAPSTISGLRLTAGKMENPFWESDMIYDEDLTPEGFAEQYIYDLKKNYSIFANFGQWVLFEDNLTQNNGPISRGADSYMFGFQIGHNWKIIPKTWELKQGIAIYDYEGLQDQAASTANTFTGAVIRNSLTTSSSGVLVWAKDFDVFTVNNELKIGVLPKLPITLQGEYVNNLATHEFNEAYKVGLKLWDAKSKGQYEIGYWYEYLEADATLSLFPDSEFGGRGTNAKGHIFKVRYNLTDYIYLSLGYWYVENINDFVRSGTGDPGTGNAANDQMRVDNRIQLNIVMKF
jgi:hypothetical protein